MVATLETGWQLLKKGSIVRDAPTAMVMQKRMGGAPPIKGVMWGMAEMPRHMAWPKAVPAKNVGKIKPPRKPARAKVQIL